MPEKSRVVQIFNLLLFLLLFRAKICQDKPSYAEKSEKQEKYLKALKRPKYKKNHDNRLSLQIAGLMQGVLNR